MSNIVLVGFMGTGKTAVAKLLAQNTGMVYVSTDDLIEEKEKTTISNIFSKKGEEYFREIEKEVIHQVSEDNNQVIDAGGGVVINSENMAELRKNGVIVCLWASVETIYARTKKKSHRPLLKVEDPVSRIKELMDKRRQFYEKADYHIETSNLSLEETVEAVKNVKSKQSKDYEKRK